LKEQIKDSPIYKVYPENNAQKTRVLHRNLLHLVNDLPVAVDHGKDKAPRKSRVESHGVSQSQSNRDSDTSDSESDSGTRYWLRVPVTAGPCKKVAQTGPTSDKVFTPVEQGCHSQPHTANGKGPIENPYSNENEPIPNLENDNEQREQELDRDTEQAELEFDSEQEEQVPTQGASLRRSARARRPPQTFTYNSMGQPSYQPQAVVGHVGLCGLQALPVWVMQPVQANPYIPHQTGPCAMTVPYTVPTRFMY